MTRAGSSKTRLSRKVLGNVSSSARSFVRSYVHSFVSTSFPPLDRPSPSAAWYRLENWPVNRNYHLCTVCIPAGIIIVTIAVDAVREGALEMKRTEKEGERRIFEMRSYYKAQLMQIKILNTLQSVCMYLCTLLKLKQSLCIHISNAIS